jgi:hypothetical protein
MRSATSAFLDVRGMGDARYIIFRRYTIGRKSFEPPASDRTLHFGVGISVGAP